jgi:hypothetical protein
MTRDVSMGAAIGGFRLMAMPALDMLLGEA